MPRVAGAALAVALTVLGGAAAAQDREADAERLFREGQRLMEERRFGEACPKFEAAYRKDGQLGTLLNLAFCHKEQGAIWYAWLEFREAEVKATELGRSDRREFAKQQLTPLEKQLPKVIVDNPQKVPLSDVLVEDRRVPEAERGAVFAAEAGQRKLTFRAKGKKPAIVLVNVVAAPKPMRVQVPELEDLPPEPPPAVEKPSPPVERPAPAPAVDASAGSTQRTVGFIALGVGGVALAVGAVTGVMVLSSDCKSATSKTCTKDDYNAIDGVADVSTITFIAGGIAAATGLTLVLTAPSSGASSPATGARGAPAVRAQLGAGWAGLSGTF